MHEVDPLSCGFDDTPDSVCHKVAEIFQVKQTEVALLELRGKLLHFIYPGELRTAGAIPISSSAVAACTAQTRKAEVFNSFTEVNHFSVFELVKLGDSGLDDQVIQKLMSAPILNANGDVQGVIQISRKGPRPTIAGPDFSRADLQKLEAIARFVSKFMAKSTAHSAAAGQI
jgi:GAF domain